MFHNQMVNQIKHGTTILNEPVVVGDGWSCSKSISRGIEC